MTGFEPATLTLEGSHSAVELHPQIGDPRFELGQTESESVVLPLHQSPLGIHMGFAPIT